MVSRSRSVCTPIELAILGPGSRARITASLAFHSDDPYAVHMIFHTRDGQEDIEWMFSRQLLSVGLLMAAGDGDVRIWPGPDGSGAVYLQLRSPHGEAMFQAERAHLVDFALRSYVVVPPGCESGYLDLDTELALLHDDLA
ncbi:MAG TPA: SsgA family sporulation/cell division regulator [Mycobacteriales bacterium]|nr:SsgA family sporulation/cell division regulator [Mycobacteriales bacterium]